MSYATISRLLNIPTCESNVFNVKEIANFLYTRLIGKTLSSILCTQLSFVDPV